jgi:NitT/TauT family transport system ATP-binding protein
MAACAVTLKGVVKDYPSRKGQSPVSVLDHISIDLPAGKVVALYGPNGCGKTTILNLAAGLDQPDSGVVDLVRNAVPGQSCSVGYLFQDYRKSLLPWKTALANVAFPLQAQGFEKADARQRASDFLSRAGFGFRQELFPYQLSAGQQQAVALAAILVRTPDILLLDEPFSAFDHRIRLDICTRFADLVQPDGATAIVSHDIDEAIFLSDVLCLLSERPASVTKSFEIPFQRPRVTSLLVTDEFVRFRRQVIESFLAEFQR